jgi:hypothetical protein
MRDEHMDTTKMINLKPGATSVFKRALDLFPAVHAADLDTSQLSQETIEKIAFNETGS